MKSSSSIAYYAGSAAANKKASDIKILNVEGISSITDYFVLCTGNSTVQVKAIADEIEEKMAEKGYQVFHREGYNNAHWILLDYGTVIVHIFYNEDRDFYDIERLWSDAEVVNL